MNIKIMETILGKGTIGQDESQQEGVFSDKGSIFRIGKDNLQIHQRRQMKESGRI